MLIYSADVVIDAIGDDYNDLVGRNPTAAETSLYLASYRTDPSLDDIRTSIALNSGRPSRARRGVSRHVG